MIFDKNEKRIRELLKADPQRYAARVEELRKRGREWWVEYRDPQRRKRSEKCPEHYQSEAGARKWEAMRISEIERGAYDCKDVVRVPLKEIFTAYLDERMSGKSGERSARCLLAHATGMIGEYRLDLVDRKPALLVNHIRDGLPVQWAPKYRHNYFITIRAALNYWIRFRRLTLKNPCDLIQMDPGTRIMDEVPTLDELDALLTQSIVVGLPDWIRRLFVVSWETGRRIGEIMRMTPQDCALDEAQPYVWFNASKQKRAMRKPKPITKRCAEALQEQIVERSKTADLWPTKNPPYKVLNGSGLREAANWRHRWFHDNRKSAEVRFRLAGGKEVAKGMLDHQTDSMAEYYTHYQVSDLACAVADQMADQKERP